MTKKEDNQPDIAQRKKSDDAATIVNQTPTAASSHVSPKRRGGQAQKRISRKVKFAEPLSEARLYERPLSPKAEVQAMKSAKNKSKEITDLNDLEPPYSLIARLDLAAKKLEARSTAKQTSPNDTLTSMKTSKSLKSIKSVKSLAPRHDTISAPKKE